MDDLHTPRSKLPISVARAWVCSYSQKRGHGAAYLQSAIQSLFLELRRLWVFRPFHVAIDRTQATHKRSAPQRLMFPYELKHCRNVRNHQDQGRPRRRSSFEAAPLTLLSIPALRSAFADLPIILLGLLQMRCSFRHFSSYETFIT